MQFTSSTGETSTASLTPVEVAEGVGAQRRQLRRNIDRRGASGDRWPQLVHGGAHAPIAGLMGASTSPRRFRATMRGLTMSLLRSAEAELEPPADLAPALAPMRLALEVAEQAGRSGEVPVGAVVVVRGQVVAVAHNQRECLNDPTAHAEIIALRAAAAALGGWRLVDAELYVTMEPCPMCAGAVVNARIRRLVYGCDDPKAGAARTLYRLLDDARLNHQVEVVPGVLAAESAALLKSFFLRLRQPAAALRVADR